MSKKSLHIKFIAFFVLLNFCLNGSNQTLYAQSVAQPAYPSSQVGVQVNLRESVRSLRLPEELGKIHELYLPHSADKKRDQFVIYLQGAHANYDSESNTKKLIHFFQKRFGLRLVLLEGGEGHLDSLFFKSFPDQELKEKILNDYLSKGDLSGGEISSILDDSFQTQYYGIETQTLYEENKAAFSEALQNEEPISKILTQIKSKLLDQSKTDFSQHVRNFFEKKQLFSRDEIDLMEYVKVLAVIARSPVRQKTDGSVLWRKGTTKQSKSEIASASLEELPRNDNFPELSKLLAAQSKEKRFNNKDFDIAAAKMIENFQKKVLPKLLKAVQMELNQMIQMYRISHLSSGLLIEKIRALSKKHNFFFDVPAVLKSVSDHTKTLSSIKGTKLFSELNSLEEKLAKLLPKTDNERKLLLDLQFVDVLERFSRLEIIHQDWQEIKTAIIPAELKLLLAPHFRFYELALKRDEAMFQNTLKVMKREKTKLALIATGGFHSEGITQKLKQSKIGYVVISPTINQFSDRSIYLNAMEDKRSFMKYFNGSLWDALAQDYASKLAAALKREDVAPSLKKWRDSIIQNSITEGRITEAGSYTKYVDALARVLKKRSSSNVFVGDPHVDSRLQRAGMTEEQIRKALESELNSFLGSYFDKMESLLKQRVQIFGTGLKDLWKTGEINPKSIGQLVERMNAVQASHVSPRLSLTRYVFHYNLIAPNQARISVSTESIEAPRKPRRKPPASIRSETRAGASPAERHRRIEQLIHKGLKRIEQFGASHPFWTNPFLAQIALEMGVSESTVKKRGDILKQIRQIAAQLKARQKEKEDERLLGLLNKFKKKIPRETNPILLPFSYQELGTRTGIDPTQLRERVMTDPVFKNVVREIIQLSRILQDKLILKGLRGLKSQLIRGQALSDLFPLTLETLAAKINVSDHVLKNRAGRNLKVRTAIKNIKKLRRFEYKHLEQNVFNRLNEIKTRIRTGNLDKSLFPPSILKLGLAAGVTGRSWEMIQKFKRVRKLVRELLPLLTQQKLKILDQQIINAANLISKENEDLNGEMGVVTVTTLAEKIGIERHIVTKRTRANTAVEDAIEAAYMDEKTAAILNAVRLIKKEILGGRFTGSFSARAVAERANLSVDTIRNRAVHDGRIGKEYNEKKYSKTDSNITTLILYESNLPDSWQRLLTDTQGNLQQIAEAIGSDLTWRNVDDRFNGLFPNDEDPIHRLRQNLAQHYWESHHPSIETFIGIFKTLPKEDQINRIALLDALNARPDLNEYHADFFVMSVWLEDGLEQSLDAFTRSETRVSNATERQSEAKRRIEQLVSRIENDLNGIQDVFDDVTEHLDSFPQESLRELEVSNYVRSFKQHLKELILYEQWIKQLAPVNPVLISGPQQKVQKILDEIKKMQDQIGQQNLQKSVKILALTKLSHLKIILREIELQLRPFDQKKYLDDIGAQVFDSGLIRFLFTKKIAKQVLYVPMDNRMIRLPIIPSQYIGKTIVLEIGTAKADRNIRVVRVYENEASPSSFLYSYVETPDGFISAHKARKLDDHYTFTHPLFPNQIFYINTSRGFDRNLSPNRFRLILNVDDSIKEILDGSGSKLAFYPVLDDFKGERIGTIILRSNVLILRWPSFRGVISKVPLLLEKRSGGDALGAAYLTMHDRIHMTERKFYFASGGYAGKPADIRMDGMRPVEARISGKKFYLILKRDQRGKIVDVARENFMDRIGNFTGSIVRFKANGYGSASLGAPLTGIQVADAAGEPVWMSAALENGVILRTDEWPRAPGENPYEFKNIGNQTHIELKLVPENVSQQVPRRPSRVHLFNVLRDFNYRPESSYKSRISQKTYEDHSGIITGLQITRHGTNGRVTLPNHDYALPFYYAGYPLEIYKFAYEKRLLFVIYEKNGQNVRDVFFYQDKGQEIADDWSQVAREEAKLRDYHGYDLNLSGFWKAKIKGVRLAERGRDAFRRGDYKTAEKIFKMVPKKAARRDYAAASYFLESLIPNKLDLLRSGTPQQKRRIRREARKYKREVEARAETRSGFIQKFDAIERTYEKLFKLIKHEFPELVVSLPESGQFSPAPDSTIPRLFSFLKGIIGNKNFRFLDFGSGDSRMAYRLALMGENVQITPVEINSFFAALAKMIRNGVTVNSADELLQAYRAVKFTEISEFDKSLPGRSDDKVRAKIRMLLPAIQELHLILKRQGILESVFPVSGNAFQAPEANLRGYQAVFLNLPTTGISQTDDFWDLFIKKVNTELPKGAYLILVHHHIIDELGLLELLENKLPGLKRISSNNNIEDDFIIYHRNGDPAPRSETRSTNLPSVAVTFGPFDGPVGKKIRKIIHDKLLEFDPSFEETAGEDILNGIASFYGGTEHNLAEITVGTLKKHYDETIKDETSPSPYKKIKFLYNFPVEQLSYDPKSAENWINQILKQLERKFGVQKFEIVPDETDPLKKRKRLEPHTLKRNSIFYFKTPIEEGAPTLLIFEKLEKNVLSFRSPFKGQNPYSISAAEFNQRVRRSATDPQNEISLIVPSLEGTTLEMPALSTGKVKSPEPSKIALASEPTVLKAFTGFLLPALERASSHRKRPVDSKLSAVEKLKQILTGQSPIRIEIVNEIEVVIEIFDKKQNKKVAQKQRIKLDHYVLDIKYEITGIDRTDEMSASMRLLVEKLIEGLSDKKIAEINQSGGFGQRIVALYEEIISDPTTFEFSADKAFQTLHFIAPAVKRTETRTKETETFEYFAQAVKEMIENRAIIYKYLVSAAGFSNSSSSPAERLKRFAGLLKKDLPGMVSDTGNPITQLYDLYEQSVFMKGDPDHDDRPYLTILKKFIESKKKWSEDETLVQRASQIAFEYYLYQAISLLAFDAYREWRENTKPDRDEQARENIRAVEDLLQQFQSGSLQKFDTDPLLSLEFLSSYLSFYEDEYRALEEFVTILEPKYLARWDEYETRLIGRHLRGVFYDPSALWEHRFRNVLDFAILIPVLNRELIRYREARTVGDEAQRLRHVQNIMEAISNDPQFMTSESDLGQLNPLMDNLRRGLDERTRIYPGDHLKRLKKYEQLFKEESGFLAEDMGKNFAPDSNQYTPLGRAEVYWPDLAKYMIFTSILNPGFEDFGFRDLLEAERGVPNAEKSRKLLWMISMDKAKRYVSSPYDALRNYNHERARDLHKAVVQILHALQKKAQFEKRSEMRSPKSIRLLDLDQFTRLEQFIIKHKYPNGMVSDGTIYLDTPLDASMRIFGEYQTYFGSLVGRNYFSFGPGAVLTDSLTAAMLEMHVTAVEKDKKIFDYAEQVKNLAEKEGLIGAGKFNLINQDAFSVSWSDQDIIFFFYTQSRFDTAKYRAAFNRKLEGKIKEMKPSAVLALLFTGSQLMAEQDDYLALESLEERRVQVSDHLTGLYLLTFQKPLGVRAETRSTENVAGHLINRLYSGDLERREKLQVIQDLGRAKVDVARRVLEAELKVAAEDPEADDEIRAALLLALQNYESREKDQLNKRDEEIVLKALGEIDQAYEVYQKESRQQWVKLFLQKVIEMLRKFFDFFNTEINWLNDLHDTFSKPFISFKTAEAHQALALYNSFRTQSQYHLPRNSVDLERNLKPGSLIISFNPTWISAALYVAVGKVTLKDLVGESYETWLFADYSPKGLPVQISEATTVRDFYGPFRADFTILLPPTKIFDPMIQRSAREIQRFLKKPFRRLRSELRSLILNPEDDWTEAFENNGAPLVVDVGAGFGLWSLVRAKNHPEINYIVVEPNLEMLSDLSNLFEIAGVKNIRIAGGYDYDLFRKQKKSNFIDQIIIQHPTPSARYFFGIARRNKPKLSENQLRDAREDLQEVNRLLKPGGQLLFVMYVSPRYVPEEVIKIAGFQVTDRFYYSGQDEAFVNQRSGEILRKLGLNQQNIPGFLKRGHFIEFTKESRAEARESNLSGFFERGQALFDRIKSSIESWERQFNDAYVPFNLFYVARKMFQFFQIVANGFKPFAKRTELALDVLKNYFKLPFAEIFRVVFIELRHAGIPLFAGVIEVGENLTERIFIVKVDFRDSGTNILKSSGKLVGRAEVRTSFPSLESENGNGLKLPEFPQAKLLLYLLKRSELTPWQRIGHLAMGTFFVTTGGVIEWLKFTVIVGGLNYLIFHLGIAWWLAVMANFINVLWGGSLIRTFLIFAFFKPVFGVKLKGLIWNFVPFVGAYFFPIAQAWEIFKETHAEYQGIGYRDMKGLNDKILESLSEKYSGFSEDERKELRRLSPQILFLILDFQRAHQAEWGRKWAKVRSTKLDSQLLNSKIKNGSATIFIDPSNRIEGMKHYLISQGYADHPFYFFDAARFLKENSGTLSADQVVLPLFNTPPASGRAEVRARPNREDIAFVNAVRKLNPTTDYRILRSFSMIFRRAADYSKRKITVKGMSTSLQQDMQEALVELGWFKQYLMAASPGRAKKIKGGHLEGLWHVLTGKPGSRGAEPQTDWEVKELLMQLFSANQQGELWNVELVQALRQAATRNFEEEPSPLLTFDPEKETLSLSSAYEDYWKKKITKEIQRLGQVVTTGRLKPGEFVMDNPFVGFLSAYVIKGYIDSIFEELEGNKILTAHPQVLADVKSVFVEIDRVSRARAEVRNSTSEEEYRAQKLVTQMEFLQKQAEETIQEGIGVRKVRGEVFDIFLISRFLARLKTYSPPKEYPALLAILRNVYAEVNPEVDSYRHNPINRLLVLTAKRIPAEEPEPKSMPVLETSEPINPLLVTRRSALKLMGWGVKFFFASGSAGLGEYAPVVAREIKKQSFVEEHIDEIISSLQKRLSSSERFLEMDDFGRPQVIGISAHPFGANVELFYRLRERLLAANKIKMTGIIRLSAQRNPEAIREAWDRHTHRSTREDFPGQFLARDVERLLQGKDFRFQQLLGEWRDWEDKLANFVWALSPQVAAQVTRSLSSQSYVPQYDQITEDLMRQLEEVRRKIIHSEIVERRIWAPEGYRLISPEERKLYDQRETFEEKQKELEQSLATLETLSESLGWTGGGVATILPSLPGVSRAEVRENLPQRLVSTAANRSSRWSIFDPNSWRVSFNSFDNKETASSRREVLSFTTPRRSSTMSNLRLFPWTATPSFLISWSNPTWPSRTWSIFLSMVSRRVPTSVAVYRSAIFFSLAGLPGFINYLSVFVRREGSKIIRPVFKIVKGGNAESTRRRAEVRNNLDHTTLKMKAEQLTRERHYFLELLHILNRHWWLIEEQKWWQNWHSLTQFAGYHNKLELGFRPHVEHGRIHWILNPAAVFEWNGPTFEGKKTVVRDIVNDRISHGYLNNDKMSSSGDQQRMFDLLGTLDIPVDRPAHIQALKIEEAGPVDKFSPAIYPRDLILDAFKSDSILHPEIIDLLSRWSNILPPNLKLLIFYSENWWLDFLRAINIRLSAGGFAHSNPLGHFVYLHGMSLNVLTHEFIHILQALADAFYYPLFDHLWDMIRRMENVRPLAEALERLEEALLKYYERWELNWEFSAYFYGAAIGNNFLYTGHFSESIWEVTRIFIRTLFHRDIDIKIKILSYLRNHYLFLHPLAPLPQILERIPGVDDSFVFPEAGWPEKSPSYEKGEKLAAEILSRIDLNPETAKELLEKLNTRPPFDWGYKEEGVRERSFWRSGTGLDGFLDSFQFIRKSGIVGQWSVAFHASNQNGRGDFLTYFDSLLEDTVGLESVKGALQTLREQTPQDSDLSARIQRDITVAGLMDGVEVYLQKVASSDVIPRAEVRRKPDQVQKKVIDRESIQKIAQEFMVSNPNPKKIAERLTKLRDSGVEAQYVIDEIGKAIDDVLEENREQQLNIVTGLSGLQGYATTQSISTILNESGVPILIPGTTNRLVQILNLPTEPEASGFSKEKLSQAQFVMSQILGFQVPSLIEVRIPEQFKLAQNPREHFKHFLETASQLVLNENIAVRVHIKGISKLASRFQRNSNDPFSVVINHDDTLIIFNGKIQNFDRFFHIPASIVIASELGSVKARRLMSDFYAADQTRVVFGNDVNVLSEFLMGAAIKLTQQTHEALIKYDQETYRLSAPGKLELMLHALADKTKQRRKFAAAA